MQTNPLYLHSLSNCCCLAFSECTQIPSPPPVNLCSWHAILNKLPYINLQYVHNSRYDGWKEPSDSKPSIFIIRFYSVITTSVDTTHATIMCAYHAFVCACRPDEIALKPLRPIKPCWWQSERPPGARHCHDRAGTSSFKLLSQCQPPHAAPRHSKHWCWKARGVVHTQSCRSTSKYCEIPSTA